MPPPTAACLAIAIALLAAAGPALAEATAAADQEAPAGSPGIATPSPSASPAQVEDAKDTAKAAELTPIVPSQSNPLKSAYQLYLEVDGPILGIGLVFAGARLVRSQPAYCAPLCERSGLNTLDRTTAGTWSPAWQGASNYGLLALGLGTSALLLLDEGLLPGLNDAVVVAESALSGIAITSLMTLAAGRPRPFHYGEKAPLSARNGSDAGLSYLSSHAVASFAIVTSTFMAMRRRHPGSKVAWVVAGVGGALATFVASARVLGGMHFITDSVGGAIVGVSTGVLVSSLHGSPVSVVPVTGEGRKGLAVGFRF
jgi:membrane-associated phospholipid phosphatase